MDPLLTAFDNAVEKLLNVPAIEPLPEQLATLRFLFEEEFDKLRLSLDDSIDVEMMLHDRWP